MNNRQEFLNGRLNNLKTELNRIETSLDSARKSGQPEMNIIKLQSRLEKTKQNYDKILKELGHK